MKINSQVYFTLQMTEPYYDIEKPNYEKSFCNPDNFVKELVSGHAFKLFDSVQCAFLLKRKVRLFAEG